MYRTIIAGCNGRERGRGAVSLAHAISTATGARLVLVGVHHHPPLPFPGSYATQRDQLEHELRAVRDELAPEALIRLEGVAPRPELHRIGVGIDATPESALALVMARELAQHTGARLSLYAVVEESIPGWVGLSPTPSYADALQARVEGERAAAQELLGARLKACESVAADGEVVVGEPAGELILASEDLDLLVLGSRRWGPVRRLALGSTSERVIRHAACPVLVPPRRAGAERPEVSVAAMVVTAP